MSPPHAHIHPDRVAACFGSGAGETLIATLRSEPRFSERLSALLASHYRLTEPDGEEMSDTDAAIAALEDEALDKLSLRAGAVVHAGAFLREIRGQVLVALGERFGQEALSDARRHRDLAVERPSHADLDALEAAVRDDGQACLGAWIAALPDAAARRMALRWPSEAAIPVAGDAAIGRNGPQILRRLAGEGACS